jgi:2'-5' RNA ligase
MMTLGGIGAFPNFRRARVVWIGVGQDPRLELLHHDVEVACEGLGFEVEGRPFRPHLTLARVRQPLAEERARALSREAKRTAYDTEFMVRSIDLMQSDLSADGPAYTTLVSAALRSG